MNDHSTSATENNNENAIEVAINEKNTTQQLDNTTQPAEEVKKIADELGLVLDIPVQMTVELGRTRMTIKDLLNLSQGSVVSLEGWVGEPWIFSLMAILSPRERLSSFQINLACVLLILLPLLNVYID